MRIAIDIRPLQGPRRTGVGQYAFRLTEALLRRSPESGLEYRLFGPGVGVPWPDDLPDQGAERCPFRIPNRLTNLGVSLAGRPRLEEMAGDFRAAWLPNIDFTASARPYAVTVHDLSFIRFPEFFSVKQRLWHSLARPRRLLREAAKVIAVSEHTKDDIVEIFGLPADRIEVVSPAAGPEYRPVGREGTDSVRRRYGLPERYFLYLGTIEPRKNIDGLIEAFGRLRTDAHLVIAGGRGWLYWETLRQAAASPARDRIRFLDYVAESDKPALYSGALALAYPSFYEGFGMPPLEAMASGCPVIAGFASSLGEVVGESGILVDPHDLSEITEAMRLMLDEPGLRERLTESGIVRAQGFSWEKGAERIESILKSICTS